LFLGRHRRSSSEAHARALGMRSTFRHGPGAGRFFDARDGGFSGVRVAFLVHADRGCPPGVAIFVCPWPRLWRSFFFMRSVLAGSLRERDTETGPNTPPPPTPTAREDSLQVLHFSSAWAVSAPEGSNCGQVSGFLFPCPDWPLGVRGEALSPPWIRRGSLSPFKIPLCNLSFREIGKWMSS